MKRFLYTAFLLGILSTGAIAQEKQEQTTKERILAEGAIKDVWAKKFRFGADYNFFWTKFDGDKISDKSTGYFYKPSVGMNVKVEYYPISYVGVGLGFGFQQRGTGVLNPDYSGGAFAHPWEVDSNGNHGNPDTTHIQRLRMNSIDVPLTILLRSPKLFNGGMKLSAAAGINYSHIINVKDTWYEVVGGMHTINMVTNDYVRNAFAYQLEFGPDINAGDVSVFQVHFIYSKGLSNVFAKDQGTAKQASFGVRIAWLF